MLRLEENQKADEMPILEILEIWMIIIGASLAFSSIPQILKIVRERESKNVSILSVLIVCNGCFWWLCYSVTIKSVSLFVTNILSLGISIITIVVIMRYRK